MGRVAAAALAALLIFAGGGCGASESGGEGAQYLDPRSDAVLAVDLDYDGGNWAQIKRLYERGVAAEDDGFAPRSLDAALDTWASDAGLSFGDDIRPLLGGTLYVGVRVEPAEPLSATTSDILERLDQDATRVVEGEVRYYAKDGSRLDTAAVDAAFAEESRRQPLSIATAAYRVEDGDALQRVLDKLRAKGLEPGPIEGAEGAKRLADGVALAGDDTIVAVATFDGRPVGPLLRERLTASGDGPELPELGDDLIAARAAPTLLGAIMDRETFARATATAPGRALRGAEASIRVEEDAGRGHARMDFEGLPDEELPLPEAAALDLPSGEGVASASADQSRTTVFLARLVRELFPDSRFVARVEELERREGLRFEDEVLRQFAGPSFSVMRPEGPDGTEFGARSTLRDPDAMRELLPRLAADLPGILEGLEGLGSTGLATLLFVAPDAPLTPSAFGILAAIHVSRLAGGADEELYEVSGLDERYGPDSVVYGLVGDAFVVASSAELAREVADLPTEEPPEAATRLRVDVPRLLEQVDAQFGDDAEVRILRALLERIELSASAEDGDIVVDAELRWAR